MADDACNRVFVATVQSSLASTASSGHLLEAADGACAGVAAASGLTGNFVAYLSSPTTPARARLGNARGFVRVDGKPVADTVEDFANGQLRHPIALAANGALGAASVVTVSTSTGTYDATANCAGMTDFTSGWVASGASQGGGAAFQNDGASGCALSSFAVYCVQTDFQTPLAQPTIASDAHRVFVSTAPFVSGGGLASADALCANEASAAGLPGAYVAFLPNGLATAASRIANDGAPVVRVDGVQVAPTIQAFIARLWTAPIATTATGHSFAGSIGMWTAAPNPFVETDGNCADYTSKSAASTTTVTLTNRVWGQVPPTPMGCDVKAAHLMCIRQ